MPIIDGKVLDITEEEYNDCMKIAEQFELYSVPVVATVIQSELYVIASELLIRGLIANLASGELVPSHGILIAVLWGIFLAESHHTKMINPESLN